MATDNNNSKFLNNHNPLIDQQEVYSTLLKMNLPKRSSAIKDITSPSLL
jgi:hypothetical protein